MVAANPYVGLFGNRRVEKPSIAIFADQLRKRCRVAVFLTKCMCFLVLGLEMKNVNGKTNVGKVGVGFDMLSERAVIIEEDMVRLDRLDAKGTLQKFLEATQLCINPTTSLDLLLHWRHLLHQTWCLVQVSCRMVPLQAAHCGSLNE